jgi:hypothetical protein
MVKVAFLTLSDFVPKLKAVNAEIERISGHFLLNESKMNFTQTNPKPLDRSIFRKNIGRALLNKQGGYCWVLPKVTNLQNITSRTQNENSGFHIFRAQIPNFYHYLFST